MPVTSSVKGMPGVMAWPLMVKPSGILKPGCWSLMLTNKVVVVGTDSNNNWLSTLPASNSRFCAVALIVSSTEVLPNNWRTSV